MHHEEEHDALWQLLGKARQPQVSPFFSRNVLREVRGLHGEPAGWFAGLRRHWQVAALTACALALAGVATLHQSRPDESLIVLAQQVSASADYSVIENLDELLEADENSVWLDNAVF